jgi:hypothetical protein
MTEQLTRVRSVTEEELAHRMFQAVRAEIEQYLAEFDDSFMSDQYPNGPVTEYDAALRFVQNFPSNLAHFVGYLLVQVNEDFDLGPLALDFADAGGFDAVAVAKAAQA